MLKQERKKKVKQLGTVSMCFRWIYSTILKKIGKRHANSKVSLSRICVEYKSLFGKTEQEKKKYRHVMHKLLWMTCIKDTVYLQWHKLFLTPCLSLFITN